MQPSPNYLADQMNSSQSSCGQTRIAASDWAHIAEAIRS